MRATTANLISKGIKNVSFSSSSTTFDYNFKINLLDRLTIHFLHKV